MRRPFCSFFILNSFCKLEKKNWLNQRTFSWNDWSLWGLHYFEWTCKRKYWLWHMVFRSKPEWLVGKGRNSEGRTAISVPAPSSAPIKGEAGSLPFTESTLDSHRRWLKASHIVEGVYRRRAFVGLFPRMAVEKIVIIIIFDLFTMESRPRKWSQLHFWFPS